MFYSDWTELRMALSQHMGSVFLYAAVSIVPKNDYTDVLTLTCAVD